jgi:hypothetical protein
VLHSWRVSACDLEQSGWFERGFKRRRRDVWRIIARRTEYEALDGSCSNNRLGHHRLRNGRAARYHYCQRFSGEGGPKHEPGRSLDTARQADVGWKEERRTCIPLVLLDAPSRCLHRRSHGAGTLYSASDLYELSIAQHGKPFYSSDKGLIAAAKARMDLMGWARGPDVYYKSLPSTGRNGEMARAIIYLEFADRPDGRDARHVGNSASVGLDSLTGEIVEAHRAVGYSYEPSDLRISREEAVSIARDGGAISTVSEITRPRYIDLSPSSHLSHRAWGLYDKKTLPYVYVVVSANNQEVAVIAADTGEILCQDDNGYKPFAPDRRGLVLWGSVALAGAVVATVRHKITSRGNRSPQTKARG